MQNFHQFSVDFPLKSFKRTKKVENSLKNCFNQLSDALNTQKLVKIHINSKRTVESIPSFSYISLCVHYLYLFQCVLTFDNNVTSLDWSCVREERIPHQTYPIFFSLFWFREKITFARISISKEFNLFTNLDKNHLFFVQ